MFGTLFSSSYVNLFICCVLLLAFDFWTVKNVTGRLMVGLRWNSVVEEDGRTTWKFEAQEEGLRSTSLDVAVFWVGLFACARARLRNRRRPCTQQSATDAVHAHAHAYTRTRVGPASEGTAHAPESAHRTAHAARSHSLAPVSPLPSRSPGVVWTLFGVGSFFRFKFEWLLLIIMALALSGANIVGYVRCKQDARSRIAAGLQGLVSRTGMNATMGRAITSAAGSAFGFGGA